VSPEDAQAAAQAQARQMVDQMAHVAAVMSGADVAVARSRMATELAVQDQVDQALDSAIDLSTHASHPDWGVTLVLGETQLMVRASKAAPQDAQETIDMALRRVTILGLVINPVCRAALTAAGIRLNFWQAPAAPPPSRLIL